MLIQFDRFSGQVSPKPFCKNIQTNEPKYIRFIQKHSNELNFVRKFLFVRVVSFHPFDSIRFRGVWNQIKLFISRICYKSMQMNKPTANSFLFSFFFHFRHRHFWNVDVLYTSKSIWLETAEFSTRNSRQCIFLENIQKEILIQSNQH